jgi:putative sporulation protein YyaC
MKKEQNLSPPGSSFRAHYMEESMVQRLADQLYSTLLSKVSLYDIIFLCIGSDRSTGDSLGPIIGSKLNKLLPHEVSVFGTLQHPVHAMNLEETLQYIDLNFKRPFIIAIDACLGDLKSVGVINFAEGPLKPGAGVQKKLPEVGNHHITGIVNVGGFMEYFVLQNTRLSLVMSMADNIFGAIYYAFNQFKKSQQMVYNDNSFQHTNI